METANKAKTAAGQIFQWALLEEKAGTNPAISLRGLFASPNPTHRASITDPARIGELLRAIDRYTGRLTTLTALKISPLAFVRPGELRKAE